MTYTETRTNEDLANVEVERWEPVASSSRPAHNFVPAVSNKPEMPTQLWQPVSSGDMDVWRPSESIREETSAVDRSVGLLIRQVPMFVVWLILAVVAGLVAWYVLPGWDAFIFGLAVLGVLSAASFLIMDRTERDYSGSGLERHRISRAAELKRLELRQAHELKRAALDAYLDHLQKGAQS